MANAPQGRYVKFAPLMREWRITAQIRYLWIINLADPFSERIRAVM
jgi:hypothetical protein